MPLTLAAPPQVTFYPPATGVCVSKYTVLLKVGHRCQLAPGPRGASRVGRGDAGGSCCGVRGACW